MKVFNLAWCRKDECTVAEHLSPRGPTTLSQAFISAALSCGGSLILPAFREDAAMFGVSAVMFHNFTLAWTKGSHSSAGACQLRSDKRISLLPVWLVTSTSKKKSQKMSVEKRADLSVFLSNKFSCVPLFLSFPSVKANERERDSLERKHWKSLSEFIAFWQGTASHFMVT